LVETTPVFLVKPLALILTQEKEVFIQQVEQQEEEEEAITLRAVKCTDQMIGTVHVGILCLGHVFHVVTVVALDLNLMECHTPIIMLPAT
jgi:hypothetical protein